MLASDIIIIDSVSWVDIATLVGAFLTFGAILLGVCVASFQLGRQAEIAESEHLMDTLRKWDDARLEESRLAVHQLEPGRLATALMELGPRDADYYTLMRVFGFFEDLGVLVCKLGVIKPESIAASLGSPIRYYWKMFRPFVCKARIEEEHPTMYEWFKELKNQVS